jgi:hypothetical protein
VLLVPVLLNVWLINLALNLWPVTQKISAVLLVVDLYLVACDFDKHSRILAILLERPGAFLKNRSRWIENSVGCCLLIAALAYAYSQIHSNVVRVNEQLADFIGDRQINRKGQWKIQQFQIDGHDATEGVGSRMYFDLWRNCSW